MEMRSRAFDSVQGTSELCRLMEELRPNPNPRKRRRAEPRCSHPAAPDASGYFLSFASTVIFVAIAEAPSPVVSTFTFEPAAVARPAA